MSRQESAHEIQRRADKRRKAAGNGWPIPRDISRSACGVSIVESTPSGYRVEYGGSLGSQWFPTLEEAKEELADWAEKRAADLERQAQNLRHIAAICAGN